MVKNLLLPSFLCVVFALPSTNAPAIAQGRAESDPRFEKLAKEF